MAKPKAPRWLTQAFADGVDERHALLWQPNPPISVPRPTRPYSTAHPLCFLAHHDSKRLPCGGQPGRDPIERFHFIARQRVENALGALLPYPGSTTPMLVNMDDVPYLGGIFTVEDRRDLILLAAWDPRNAELGCEHHHRRYDGHACSPRAPRIEVPPLALPIRTVDFVFDYGLEVAAEDRFPGFTDALEDDR